MDPAHVVEAYFKFLPLLVGISVLWTGGWVWASVAYRRSRGKPIVFTGVDGADYVETAASGHSHRAWYTRLGGANRVLVVAVAGGRLIIRPRFPFNLMFLPEVYGLEYEVRSTRSRASSRVKAGRVESTCSSGMRRTTCRASRCTFATGIDSVNLSESLTD